MTGSIKAVILAGGRGTRLSEVTESIPKPMVTVGGKPILWHIMKGYAAHGITEFVIALGHKGEVIKDYFVNYRFRRSSMVVRLDSGAIDVRGGECEAWTVHLLDTGEHTQTGGRVKRVMEYLGPQRLLLTYGDGVADIDITRLLEFHETHGKLATVTAVRPPARFGGMQFDGDLVSRFEEKPQIGEGWINGGYFVFEPAVLDYIDGDQTLLEQAPLERLAQDGELVSYRHESFWQCMDTLRDTKLLEGLWADSRAPWKIWPE
jgi:glucose-1-phosphate cytidylyltransferase